MKMLKLAALPCALALVLLVASPLRAESSFTCAYSLSPLDDGIPRAGKIVANFDNKELSSLRALVIFADFPGPVPSATRAPDWAQKLLDPDTVGSLSHFYKTMSFGQFAISGQVIERRYLSQRLAAEYLAIGDKKNGAYGRFASEILARADRDIDFGLFDNDGPDGQPNSGDDDGVVDYIFLNMEDVPRRFIRGGATGIAGLDFARNQRTDDRRSGGGFIEISGNKRHGSLLERGSFSQTVGVMAHEFGHALDLPDLYDIRYDDPAEDSAGIGRWGLMGWGAHGWSGGDGPVGFSAWSLERLGWISADNGRLVEVVRDAELRIDDLFAGGRVYKVHLPPRLRVERSASGREFTEADAGYLLLEQRTRGEHNYYHRGQPGDGLLVWHVKSAGTSNGDERSKAVDLVCADGLRSGADDLDYWAHDAAYARANGGNKGDAGDLFDGVRFNRLDLDSNPSINSLGVFGAPALKPLALDIRRDGQASLVQVQSPRWAGSINEEVHWAGTVLVDGDLVVEAEGRLILYRETQVRVSPRDALRSGLDADLVEVVIEGDLLVKGAYAGGGSLVQMRGLHAGDAWYGLIIDPAQKGIVQVPENSLQLFGAERGIILAGAPPDAYGLYLSGLRVLDEPQGLSAGNGDGRLDPGETAQIILEIDNWSLVNFRDMKVKITWDNPLLRLGWKSDTRRQIIREFTLAPGGGRRLDLGGLQLDSAAGRSETVSMRVEVSKGRSVRWVETIELELGRAQYRPEVKLTASGSMPVGRLAVSAEQPVDLRLDVVQGEVAAVELVAYHQESEQVLAEVPMQRQADGHFSGTLQVPTAGTYTLVARLYSAEGQVVFSKNNMQAKVLFERWQPVLVVYNHWGRNGQREDFVEALDAVLDARGIGANVLPSRDIREVDAALLRHYAGVGKAVLWLGRSFSTGTSTALTAFLDAGGNLLVSSPTFHWRTGKELRARLPFSRARASDNSALQGRTSLVELELDRLSYSALSGLVAGSRPLFVNGQGDTAAVQMDNGTYRMAYFGFDLYGLVRAPLQDVLEKTLAFLFAERAEGQLLVQGVENLPPLARLGAMRPALRVRNIGTGTVPPFNVGYEVHGSGGPVAARRQHQRALRPGESRLIEFAPWMPRDEDRYLFAFSIADAESGTLLEKLERPVAIADLHGQFETQVQIADTLSNGAAFFDYDNDGDLDIYLVRLSGHNALYRNDGGSFVETAQQAGLADADRGRALAIGDYDGDGDLDLYLVNEKTGDSPGINHLLQNLGHGFFADVTHATDADPNGVVSLADPNSGRSAGFVDYDNDGDLDLFLINARGGPESENRLFHNVGSTYRDVADIVGLADASGGRGLAIGDYDGDGDADFYVASHQRGRAGTLYRNDVSASGRFASRGAELGIAPAAFEVGAVFGDYDNDGDLDLFVSSETGENMLWRNLKYEVSGMAEPTFARVSADLGARATGAAFVDYDNDGDLDLATTAIAAGYAGDQLFHNFGKAGFSEVGSLLGLRDESAGRGLVWGDYDGDGLLDLLVADSKRSTLYRNGLEPLRWLQVELQGTGANSSALGARVELSVDGKRQVRELQSSYGYSSQRQPWLHFGLGGEVQVDSLKVLWPDGRQSFVLKVMANQRLVLVYPGGALKKTALPEGISLGFARPNPFNAETLIPFQLIVAGLVRLDLYNVLGQQVRTLLNESREAGAYQLVWDGRDANGRALGSGVYLYRLQVGGDVQTRQLLLLK